MHTRSAFRAAALGAVLVPAALLATGCSVIDQVLHKEQTLSFEDAAAFAKGWNRAPSWIPDDATTIHGTASTDSSTAAVLLRSSQELDPSLCAEVPRQSAPVYALTDAPDVFERDTVYACGDWTVAATKDGWLGWTPNHPDEAAASPAS